MSGFNDKLTISEEGLSLIKRWEGLRLTAYRCSAGVPTIGYGHTRSVDMRDVQSGTTITEAEADTLLRQDVREAEHAVRRLVKVPVYQSQFDALVSFTFNLGSDAFGPSTLLRHVNAREYHLVPFQFSRWVYATNPQTGRKEKLRGLVSRRADEAALFAREIARGDLPAREVTPAPVRAERPNLSRSRTMYGGAASFAGPATSAVSGTVAAIEPLTEQTPWLPSVLAGLVVAGLVVGMIGAAIVLYARRDDFLRSQS